GARHRVVGAEQHVLARGQRRLLDEGEPADLRRQALGAADRHGERPVPAQEQEAGREQPEHGGGDLQHAAHPSSREKARSSASSTTTATIHTVALARSCALVLAYSTPHHFAAKHRNAMRTTLSASASGSDKTRIHTRRRRGVPSRNAQHQPSVVSASSERRPPHGSSTRSASARPGTNRCAPSRTPPRPSAL